MNPADIEQHDINTLREWVDPARTALLIVDMQVDFASPEGALGRGGAQLDAVPAALSAASRLARAARSVGAVVAFLALETRDDTDSRVWIERLRRVGLLESGVALCRFATPGAAFYGPIPEHGDLMITKARYSGFFDTRLDATLRGRGVDTLVVSGMTTECCVDCTVRDAFHLDYHVFVAADACAGYDAQLHHSTLKSLALNFAIVVSSQEIESSWRQGSPRERSKPPPDRARGRHRG